MKRISFLKWSSISLALLTLVACAPSEHNPQDNLISRNVIYGSDGRLDLYQVDDTKIKTLADSTVALIKNSDLLISGGLASIHGKNYGSEMNLCRTEKYREQNTAAFCSGSLVGPDLILTAGHCIESMADCTSTSFVFGFALKSAGVLPQSVQASEVYKCKEIIKTVRTPNDADFAVIRLDRAVSNHHALSVRPSGDVEASASLVVIGHPVGLPTKITMGGTVRSTAPPEHFVANLDTYGGNSGSAVFNLATGLIEGVLVRGEQDFEQRGSCMVSKVCSEGSCRGEDVTKISAVRQFLSVNLAPPDNQVEKFEAKPNLNIPDNNTTGVTNSLQVLSAANGRSVQLNINIEHTYIGDLIVKLQVPSGKLVSLHQRAGGSIKNLIKSFDLTALVGSSSAGTYKLIVQDLASRDVGLLVSWSIELKKK